MTIAIPTFERAVLLKLSIASALGQDFEDVRVLVLDNASADSTREVVASFTDERLCYMRSDVNIGRVSNWNRAIALNTSPYLVVLQDDDLLLPSFVSESLARLRQFPEAALSFAHVRQIDEAGIPGNLTDPYQGDAELTDGLHFLHLAVSGKGWVLHNSAVMLRAAALARIGGRFDSAHARSAFDFNLFVRLAAHFDVVPVLKELAHVRAHPGQDTALHWRTGSGTGPFGITAERIDALAHLLGSARAEDPAYRAWLMERLLNLNAQASAYAHPLLPDLYWDWTERLQIARRELECLVRSGEGFVLADENQWDMTGEFSGRPVVAFNARGGSRWGAPPADDAEAIAETRRLQRDGPHLLVVAWPAFWWLEHYEGFNAYLGASAKVVLKNPRMIVFRLTA